MPYGQLTISPSAVSDLIPVFRHQLEHCRLDRRERVVAVTDSAFHPHYAAACMGAALDLGAESFQAILPHGTRSSEDTLRALFQPADLIVYATTHALHYTAAMREALDEGKRALMAVVPLHVLERRLADPDLMGRARAGARLLERAQTVEIRSPGGTELTASVAERRGVASYGFADRPGHLDFWGAGCFQVAVVEGSVEGTLVLDTGDQVFHFGRYVDRPTTITFRGGRATRFEGGVEARMIQRHLEAAGEESAFFAGHLAFGVDRRALWTAEASQFPVAGGGGADAEAFYGNVQVELGSNDDVMFRGHNRSSVHLGLCSLNCSVRLDGESLLEHGEFVLPALRD